MGFQSKVSHRAKLARAAATLALLTCLGLVGAAAASARTTGNPCGELPAPGRSLCVGPGVHCIVKPDAHRRWETVIGTEPTKAHAEATAKKAIAKGFGPIGIEADVRCSNGNGVYEVARARFTTRAAAVALAAHARAKGFGNARVEDS
jgi:hypothetical protein